MRSACFLMFFLLAGGVATPSVSAQDDLADHYRETAGRIIGAAMTDEEGWEKLVYLTTVIGNRLSGSPQLETAVDWVYQTMKAEGLDNVQQQPVKVPHWVRGEESAWIVEPVKRPLPILGLGGSVGTGPEGVEAPVIVVDSWRDFDALSEKEIQGHIVVFAVDWEGYGTTVRYRSDAAWRGAERGAVASLIRSATGRSLATLHTGALRYEANKERIPGASITPEDAAWFRRMRELGEPVKVRLSMEAQTVEDADSANVIAEIRGSELPEEVVVMGGHIDSWDVGQGAHDDGAACMAAWQALKLIADLGLRPRRTLRVVLWTNEENGLAGGRAYREWVGDAVSQHVAAIEMDGGAERPIGFGFGGGGDEFQGPAPSEESMQPLLQIGSLLAGLDASSIMPGGGGADIGPLMRDGVPGLALRTVGEHYFDWHHTNADTLDKVEPINFKKAVAMLGVMGFVLADMEGTLSG